MGWGSHPDTLSMAQASGAADRTGHPEGSLEWTKAYRSAYEAQNRDEPFGDSLKEYLDGIDRRIIELSRLTPFPQ